MHSSFQTLREMCSMTVGIRVQLHTIPDALAKDVARISELWSDGVGKFGGPFLTGKAFTAADAFYAPVAFRVQSYGLKLDPVAQAYGQRLLDLPAMKEWYEAGLAETFRDEHEEVPLKYGTVTHDLRAKAR